MVLVSFGVSVCLSLSVVPLGEQQSLSEDGGNVGGGGSTSGPWGLGQEGALGGPWTSGEG